MGQYPANGDKRDNLKHTIVIIKAQNLPSSTFTDKKLQIATAWVQLQRAKSAQFYNMKQLL